MDEWYFDSDRKFSLLIADRLSYDTSISDAMMGISGWLGLETDNALGCWNLYLNISGINELSGPIWKCCQAIAEALLSSPIPAD